VLRACLCRQHLKPRNRDNWNTRCLRESLYRTQPNAHAGETSRPAHGNQTMQIVDPRAAPAQKIADRGYQRGRVTSSFQLELVENLHTRPGHAFIQASQRHRTGWPAGINAKH